MPCAYCTTNVREGPNGQLVHHGPGNSTCAACNTPYDDDGRPISKPAADANENKERATEYRTEITKLMKQLRKGPGGAEAVRNGVFKEVYANLAHALEGFGRIEQA
ncbi:hypothetical protein LTR65_002178 [Meristemomyces frigidus]